MSWQRTKNSMHIIRAPKAFLAVAPLAKWSLHAAASKAAPTMPQTSKLQREPTTNVDQCLSQKKMVFQLRQWQLLALSKRRSCTVIYRIPVTMQQGLDSLLPVPYIGHCRRKIPVPEATGREWKFRNYVTPLLISISAGLGTLEPLPHNDPKIIHIFV
ncbi:hypothetical protein HO173_006113 [Letharia columbiana]|uniref:Uncharacterized protein n=1 Tax=Letharia columbiana TaxID=112416 RepID=A0A8H6FWE1_9LECA|nr:uncharacterized protein HO173_006113 [Letharia columbiana]KAF6235917.1 hypothetical protein HO173_006113 [Letharia columbiana]